MPSKKPKAKKTHLPPESVEREAVTRLAYELYVRRGCEPGHDVEDWLMAEQILVEETKRLSSTRRASDAVRRQEDKLRRH